MKEPLYQSLARDLRQAILSGTYPRGTHLPTEEELCATHGISRHTAREALRLLSQEGLIQRQRGAGSIVTGRSTARDFTQSVRGVPELLQYAREARLVIRSFGPAEPGPGERRELGLPEVKWVRLTGTRGDPGAPVALSTIFVRADLCPSRAELEAWPGAISELVERQSGVRVTRIEQRIAAATLVTADARRLAVPPGTAALRTTRRYEAADGVFQASISLHPAGRFTYVMTMERGRRR